MRIVRVKSSNRHFQDLILNLDRELRERYGPAQGDLDAHNVVETVSKVVLAYLGEEPVGCGCFKRHDETTAEIKRMFVKGAHRGRGIAEAILKELEIWAVATGFSRTILETGLAQPDAMGLYIKNKYRIIAGYGPYVDRSGSVCLGKNLF